MRPQYSGRMADAGFDGSSIFFLALIRGEIPPRAPAAAVSSRRYFYVANLDSGTAVLGKNLWSVYRAVMAPTRGIAEKRGEAFFIYIYINTHILV